MNIMKHLSQNEFQLTLCYPNANKLAFNACICINTHGETTISIIKIFYYCYTHHKDPVRWLIHPMKQAKVWKCLTGESLMDEHSLTFLSSW